MEALVFGYSLRCSTSSVEAQPQFNFVQLLRLSKKTETHRKTEIKEGRERGTKEKAEM